MPNTIIPKAYDPAQVNVTLGTVEPFDFAPDTKLVFSKTSDLILPQVGVDGAVAVAINHDNLGTLTLSLKNTSEFNKTLMQWTTAVRAQSSLTSTSTPFFPVLVKDPASNIKLDTFGWIQSQPDWTVGTEVGQLDWVIGLVDINFKVISGQSAIEAITAALFN